MAIRLKLSAELTYLAPAIEIVIVIFAFFERDHLCEAAEQQRKCASGSDDADGHIMLIEHKHVTVQS